MIALKFEAGLVFYPAGVKISRFLYTFATEVASRQPLYHDKKDINCHNGIFGI